MNDREKWYEKTWEWIKKYWGIVLSAVTLAIGYIIGIGGEIPLKHITFGIGADVGWSRTRSFVCPSAWIVLN